MSYVDGFVIAVPKDRLEDYRKLAQLACDVWKEYGAREYVEAVADDVPYGEVTSFPRAVQAKPGDLVVFAYITFDSREHRDEVNAKVMKDPRMDADMANMPFDPKLMIYGGFRTFIEARS